MSISLKSLNPSLLKRLPGLLEAQRLENEERLSRRVGLIASIADVRRNFDKTEADLIARAAPIEKRLKALRDEVADLEKQLAPLADARLSAMFSSKESIRRLEAELRADAEEEIHELQNSIDRAREKISTNWQASLDSVLSGFQRGLPTHERQTMGMSRTLAAFNQANRIAVEAPDVGAALDQLRQSLLEEGIDLEAADGRPRI